MQDFESGCGRGRNRGAGGRLGFAALTAVAALALAASAETLVLPVPSGVLPPDVPADNPPTAAKVELGKRLYFDTRISTDGTVACVTCHDPRSGFADPRGKPTSAGVGGALGTRNAPTTLNAAFLASQFWDGRAATLEAQAVLPLENPIEHGFENQAAVLAKLKTLGEYPLLFQSAFGSPEISSARVGQAIASFERTLLSLDAPIDRFLAGDTKAISASAQRGWEVFNAKARCNTCHGRIDVLPLFTDDLFHNIGVGVKRIDFPAVARRAAAAVEAGKSIDELALGNAEASELGRFLVTREQKDMGAFKTSQLRNVALTAPYMHDGSEATLESVIEFYDRGGENNPYLDGGMRPLALTAQEKADLVELMKTFTSSDLARFADLEKLGPKLAPK
ncbi:MAG TPA: cytochrome c peroxidase [Myxococcota bacterium]|jgi:cytochrome c peroxidase